MSTKEYGKELDVATLAARQAGAAILDFYNARSAAVYEKKDGSEVTDADLASDRIIREVIGDAFPGDPFLTEEGVDDEVRLASERVWIVDPIDGTNQFVNRTGEFEVLIALVVGDRPVVSVVYQPTGDVLLRAIAGEGAEIERQGRSGPLRFESVAESAPPRVLTSSWLGAPANVPALNRVSAALGGAETIVSNVGVSARRFVPPETLCDAFVGVHVDGSSRYAWEWDFAAPDLVVFEAGGATTDLAGNLHRYNKPNPVNIGGIVMSVDPTTQRRLLRELASVLTPEQARNG
ncbi:MAG: 3'(2'),5'-bisphosphate nucleotidase CysQ [Thermomicrobiales bacterium]|nr:3'(2'),5'-bisphosphate nucleotidase CysQ [Thermomicrobiales bacterium]